MLIIGAVAILAIAMLDAIGCEREVKGLGQLA
jgi:hypothetical protein